VTVAGQYAVERRPFFLEAQGRRLYAIHFSATSAAGTGGPRRAALVLAPFAEEMNRSRRMMTLQAETLAARGIEVLVFDYSGTGDSGGEFASARWDAWLSDCEAALGWLKDDGSEIVHFVGIRLGAVLASLLKRRHGADAGQLVLWQPVVSGRTFLTQFLRIRIAASLEEGTGRETTASLRDRFEAGETLEIAGYEVPAPLAMAIDELRLIDLAPPAGTVVHWFDLSAEGSALLPASRPVAEAWQAAGPTVLAEPISGEPFWSIQEVTVAPRLIAATAAALGTSAREERT
jgi:exosortase A-associated hydrolase 2